MAKTILKKIVFGFDIVIFRCDNPGVLEVTRKLARNGCIVTVLLRQLQMLGYPGEE